MFHEILSSQLPESDKTVSRLKDEAAIVVAAGTVTTGWALSVATYHLLASPEILARLKTELNSAVPNHDVQPIPLAALENCGYLVAVVQEAIRLSYGVASRLQRISPDKEMVFRDQSSKEEWVIPPGTPVGMTSVLVHQDPSIFPDPHSFRPERWIENPRLDRFLVSFSKGSRQCLGINLAYAEMYLCLFAIFSRFGSGGPDGVRMDGDEGVLELFETGLKDVEVQADGFVPLAAEGSQGVRIRVKSWAFKKMNQKSGQGDQENILNYSQLQKGWRFFSKLREGARLKKRANLLLLDFATYGKTRFIVWMLNRISYG